MSEKKRSYSPDFRIEAAKLVLMSGSSVEDIARTINVLPSTLSSWVTKLKKQLRSTQHCAIDLDEDGQLPLENKHESSSQAEIEQLRSEVERLQRERKIIKEAILLLTT